MKLKHSKYRNTGILFELLTRQLTSETISGTKTKAIFILRKYFNQNSTQQQISLTKLNQDLWDIDRKLIDQLKKKMKLLSK